MQDSATGRRYDAGFEWPQPSLKSALHALEVLSEDPNRTEAIGEFLASTGTDAFRGVFRRVLADPVGRRILCERRDLLAALKDRERLSQLPRGTLGRDYFEWTEARDFTATGLAEIIRPEARTFESEAHVFEARVIDMHDLWHVLGGWGSDLFGEMHLIGCSYAQLRSPGWLIIGLLFNLSLVTAGRVDGVAYFLRSYRIGARAKLLAAVDWEQMLALPTSEVRRRVGMPRPKGYRKLEDGEWKRLQSRSLFFRLIQQQYSRR